MKTVRWILFCLLAFGLGTGVALAVNPPTVGIPSSTASKLSADLTAIQGYASDGKCTAVRARLSAAQSRISKLPADTNTSVVTQLQSALQDVGSSARAACQQVADAQLAAEQKAQEAEDLANQATTPTTPTETTPDAVDPTTGGDDGGGPDPGTGEGATTPPGPSSPGSDTPGGGPGAGADGGPNGGTALDGETIEQQVREARQRVIDRIQRAADRWSAQLDEALRP